MNDLPIGEQARDALRRHVLVPLLPRCIDREHGGFLVDFDNRWRFAGKQDKSLEHAARTTIVMAQLAEAMPGRGYEDFVRHGCGFLQEAMWDDVHGGFFARVDRSGRPLWNGLKHPHAVTYVARAFLLAEPYLPPGDGPKWLNRALAWLDEIAWDATRLGYWGSFRRDNERYADGAALPTPDGRDIFGLVPGFKEINTQGDAIDLLTRLELRNPGGGYAEKLRALVELVDQRLMQPLGVLPYRYWPDWRPAPDLIRVGYQFMMARHLVAAAAVVRAPNAVVRACELVDFALASAAHPAGGLCFAVTADGRAWPATGRSTDIRQWWVQIEAVHTLHILAEVPGLGHTAAARYRQARNTLWSFVRDNLFDERYGGVRELPREPKTGWRRQIKLWLRNAAPSLKSHCWKDASHEVDTFLELAGDSRS